MDSRLLEHRRRAVTAVDVMRLIEHQESDVHRVGEAGYCPRCLEIMAQALPEGASVQEVVDTWNAEMARAQSPMM